MIEPTIAILDFGAQYAQLIARRVRENQVHSKLFAPSVSPETLRAENAVGIILSGGPASVYDENAPLCDPNIFELGIPVLGLCYGLQVACHLLGGRVGPGTAREFGRTQLRVLKKYSLLGHVPAYSTVWMTHGDVIGHPPFDFLPIAPTPQCPL